jgi:Poly(ADP-ribose) polymerase catalytic domain
LENVQKVWDTSANAKDIGKIDLYVLNCFWSIMVTWQDWSLELEEVFALEREGEADRYASYRNKLRNKMLLWHGTMTDIQFIIINTPLIGSFLILIYSNL